MSEWQQVMRFLEKQETRELEFRREVSERFTRVEGKQDLTNGRVNSHDRELAVLSTRGEDDREGKKRLKDFVPTVALTFVSMAFTILLYTVILPH